MRKGIILAGGKGSRLYPATEVTSKQLLPIFDKPMIYYPLSVLMLAGIREILIISTPEDTPRFEMLLKDGSELGLHISYMVQPKPEGLPHAFILAENFLAGYPCCLILGDNLFYGNDLTTLLRSASKQKEGAIIFACKVANPEKYGVITFDKANKPQKIIEKPTSPISRFAVPGLYFYDERVSAIAKTLVPSARGELEISDLNQKYLNMNELDVMFMKRGMAWMDMGTFESLLIASNFIETVQSRHGIKIACPEEIAYRMGFISSSELKELALQRHPEDYGKYLLDLLEEE